MSDLRTRIAAALKAQAEFRGIYKIADFDFPFLAEAVIRELGMRREADPKAQFHMEPPRWRYVTDWTADIDTGEAVRSILSKPMRDPDMIAAEQEWRAKHGE